MARTSAWAADITDVCDAQAHGSENAMWSRRRRVDLASVLERLIPTNG
jgi:hypothetical protein